MEAKNGAESKPNRAGLGASHQTGWTGLVAKLIQQQSEFGTIVKTA
jgi:hypothetical protein